MKTCSNCVVRRMKGRKIICDTCNNQSKHQAVNIEQRDARRTLKQDNKLKAIEYKGGSCYICRGKFHPCAMDFHHLNPHEKEVKVADILKGKFRKAISELDKCILVCANCHRILHYGSIEL